jgi:hypothetical protein
MAKLCLGPPKLTSYSLSLGRQTQKNQPLSAGFLYLTPNSARLKPFRLHHIAASLSNPSLNFSIQTPSNP